MVRLMKLPLMRLMSWRRCSKIFPMELAPSQIRELSEPLVEEASMIKAVGITAFFLVSFIPPEDAIARRARSQGRLIGPKWCFNLPRYQNASERVSNHSRETYNAKLGLLIVPSLHDDVLEKFAKKVAQRWQFDRHLDGALLVVSMRERESYVESFGKVRRAVNTHAQSHR